MFSIRKTLFVLREEHITMLIATKRMLANALLREDDSLLEGLVTSSPYFRPGEVESEMAAYFRFDTGFWDALPPETARILRMILRMTTIRLMVRELIKSPAIE